MKEPNFLQSFAKQYTFSNVTQLQLHAKGAREAS